MATPGVLFRSDDGGNTWEVNRRPSRAPDARRSGSPAQAGMCCHSIQVGRTRRCYIAISAAGAIPQRRRRRDLDADQQGRRSATFIRRSIRRSASACNKLLVHPARPGPSCGSRTTAASIARTTEATTGSGSTETGCPSDFGFRARARRGGPGRRLRDPGGVGRATLHARRPARRLPDRRRRRFVAAHSPNGLPRTRLGRGAARGLRAYDDGGLYFGTQSGSVLDCSAGGGEWIEAVRDPAADPLRRSARTSDVAVDPPAGNARRGGGRAEGGSSSMRATVGEALHELPVTNLLFDESRRTAAARQRLRRRRGRRGGRLLDEPLTEGSEVGSSARWPAADSRA